MATSELEETWDASTEKLRQTMIAFAELQTKDLREEWIAILKRRFGENYNREYRPQRLAGEHQKTPKPQQTRASMASLTSAAVGSDIRANLSELEARHVRSMVELRNCMLAYAEGLENSLKEDYINLIKARFGENYQRDLFYDFDLPPPPLVEELQGTHSCLDNLIKAQLGEDYQRDLFYDFDVEEEKTQELQRHHTEREVEPKLMVISDIPQGYFVEHLVSASAQEVQTLKKIDEQDLYLSSFTKSIKQEVGNLTQKDSCGLLSWDWKLLCSKKSQFLKGISVKQIFHRARFKRGGDFSNFVKEKQQKKARRSLGSQRNHRVLKQRSMKRILRVRKGSMGWTYAKARERVCLSSKYNGKIGYGFRLRGLLNPCSHDVTMVVNVKRDLMGHDSFIKADGEVNHDATSDGKFVEQVVSLQSQEASRDSRIFKGPNATQSSQNRRIHVKRSYHKARKRRFPKLKKLKSLKVSSVDQTRTSPRFNINRVVINQGNRSRNCSFDYGEQAHNELLRVEVGREPMVKKVTRVDRLWEHDIVSLENNGGRQLKPSLDEGNQKYYVSGMRFSRSPKVSGAETRSLNEEGVAGAVHDDLSRENGEWIGWIQGIHIGYKYQYHDLSKAPSHHKAMIMEVDKDIIDLDMFILELKKWELYDKRCQELSHYAGYEKGAKRLKLPLCSGLANHIWEPGGVAFEQEKLKWLEKCYICDPSLKAYRVNSGNTYGSEFEGYSLEQVLVYKYGCLILSIGSPFSPKIMGSFEGMTNTGGKLIFYLEVSGKTWWKLMMMESRNSLLLVKFTKCYKGDPALKTMRRQEIQGKSSVCMYHFFIHLEDKVSFSEASSSQYNKYRELLCYIEKNKPSSAEGNDKKVENSLSRDVLSSDIEDRVKKKNLMGDIDSRTRSNSTLKQLASSWIKRVREPGGFVAASDQWDWILKTDCNFRELRSQKAAEFLGRRTLVKELLVTGQKMQRSWDRLPNCGSGENHNPVFERELKVMSCSLEQILGYRHDCLVLPMGTSFNPTVRDQLHLSAIGGQEGALKTFTGLPSSESIWEPLSELLIQIPDCNLEDKVSSQPGSIDRSHGHWAFMKNKRGSKGGKARALEKGWIKNVKNSG